MTTIPKPRSIQPDTLTSEQLHTAAYFDFLYGFGAGPGIDLGAPVAYGRAPSSKGFVWRQTWEHGVTVANLGDEPDEIVLDHPYYDLDNVLRTRVTLPGHSVEVLRDAG
jgi:hypothetical protein